MDSAHSEPGIETADVCTARGARIDAEYSLNSALRARRIDIDAGRNGHTSLAWSVERAGTTDAIVILCGWPIDYRRPGEEPVEQLDVGVGEAAALAQLILEAERCSFLGVDIPVLLHRLRATPTRCAHPSRIELLDGTEVCTSCEAVIPCAELLADGHGLDAGALDVEANCTSCGGWGKWPCCYTCGVKVRATADELEGQVAL